MPTKKAPVKWKYPSNELLLTSSPYNTPEYREHLEAIGACGDTEEESNAEYAMDASLEYYRSLITKKDCWCGYKALDELRIEMYPHSGGWPVGGINGLQWLYVICEGCGHQWNLWHLGVPREAEG